MDAAEGTASRPRRVVMARGSVLVVEDDRLFACRVSAPYFSRRWSVVFATDLLAAHQALAAIEDLRLALVDLDLPGGLDAMPLVPGSHGFEIVARIRSERPEAWVVILTGHVDEHRVNTAQRLGADYICKRQCQENLRALAKRLEDREVRARSALDGSADLIASKYKLSKRQAQIFRLALRGNDTSGIARELGIAASSVKTHVRALLRKSGKPSLRALTHHVYRML
jgi:DNA-binding NarL/FixJ family response regulator